MQGTWDALSFDLVILDYFFAPAHWVDDRWSAGLFLDTLPTLVLTGRLVPLGNVWLPNIPYVTTMLQKHEDFLTSYYCWEIAADCRSNPLYQATENIDSFLASIGRYTNGTQLVAEKQFQSSGYFYKLTAKPYLMPWIHSLPTEGGILRSLPVIPMDPLQWINEGQRLICDKLMSFLQDGTIQTHFRALLPAPNITGQKRQLVTRQIDKRERIRVQRKNGIKHGRQQKIVHKKNRLGISTWEQIMGTLRGQIFARTPPFSLTLKPCKVERMTRLGVVPTTPLHPNLTLGFVREAPFPFRDGFLAAGYPPTGDAFFIGYSTSSGLPTGQELAVNRVLHNLRFIRPTLDPSRANILLTADPECSEVRWVTTIFSAQPGEHLQYLTTPTAMTYNLPPLLQLSQLMTPEVRYPPYVSYQPLRIDNTVKAGN